MLINFLYEFSTVIPGAINFQSSPFKLRFDTIDKEGPDDSFALLTDVFI